MTWTAQMAAHMSFVLVLVIAMSTIGMVAISTVCGPSNLWVDLLMAEAVFSYGALITVRVATARTRRRQ